MDEIDLLFKWQELKELWKQFRCLHSWTLYRSSGFGRAKNLRVCEKCHRNETQLYDLTSHRHTWVRGNFFEDVTAPIYIIAGSRTSYLDAKERVVTRLNLLEMTGTVYWLQFPKDVYAVQESSPWPRIYLADDWFEADIVTMAAIRRLFSTGHW